MDDKIKSKISEQFKVNSRYLNRTDPEWVKIVENF